MPHPLLVRTWHGARPGRSGEILLVPKEPNYINGGLSHSGPWDHLQRVPMFWFGPGLVRPQGELVRSVSMAALAPTLARLIGFGSFSTPDGGPMWDALEPVATRPLPRLVVTVVWDGGGWDVLDRWPNSWPILAGLVEQGTMFTNFRLGTSPSVTPPIHATIGTGTFPMRHGVTDNQVRRPDGSITDAWSTGPSTMLEPSLADLYDAAMDNEPVVANVATGDWHLGMIGHGSLWPGGDADVAVTHEGTPAFTWNLREHVAPYYRFPEYVNEVGGYEADIAELDAADGAVDGMWRDNPIADLGEGFFTPARQPYQTRVVEEIVRQEGMGTDDVPDLLYVNYKLIDGVGHDFGIHSLEEKDTVRWTDRELGRLIDFLDVWVGPQRWALALTADHGINPQNPAAFRISLPRMTSDLRRAFDRDGDGVSVVQRVRPSMVFLNVPELRQGGHTVADVAAFLNRYTEGQNLTTGGGAVAGRTKQVLSAAVPTGMLPRLACLPEARA
jgi:hypothetical protein